MEIKYESVMDDVEREAALRHKVASDIRTYAEIANLREMHPHYLAALVVAEAIAVQGLGKHGVPTNGPLT